MCDPRAVDVPFAVVPHGFTDFRQLAMTAQVKMAVRNPAVHRVAAERDREQPDGNEIDEREDENADVDMTLRFYAHNASERFPSSYGMAGVQDK